jgi:hypothetical protein
MICPVVGGVIAGSGGIVGYAERNMIRTQHVDKGKLNKCMLKASWTLLG